MYTKSVFFKKIAIIFILSVGFVLSVFSQNQTIDSLNSILVLKRGVDRIKILIELAKQNNMVGNYEIAYDFANEAVSLALDKGDSLEIVMAYRFKGAALRRMERLDEALYLIIKANAIAKRNNFISETKFLLNSMALIYTNKAQYDLALNCNFQSLTIREAEGDQSEISITLNNIGLIYFKLKNYKRALEYFNKSIVIRRQTGDNYSLETVLINVGLSEVHLRNFNDAIDHLNEAFAVCGDQCSDDVKMEGEFGLGVAYYNLGKLDKSLGYFNTSYNLAKKGKSLLFQSENLIYLGKILIQLNDLVTAEKFLKDAEEVASGAGYNRLLIDTYKELYKLYSLNRNSEKEILYQKKYIELNDSLISLDLVNNIAMIQAGFEERQNVKTIGEQDDLLKLRQEIIANVRAQYFFILTITILSILLTFVFIRFNRKQQRTNVELTRAKREIESNQSALAGWRR